MGETGSSGARVSVTIEDVDRPRALAILVEGSDRWHFGARYLNGPVLVAEECNIDAAISRVVYEFSEVGDLDDAELCGHCAQPIVTSIRSSMALREAT